MKSRKKPTRRPGTYWRLSYDDLNRTRDIGDYDGFPWKGFDYLQLKSGAYFKGKLPKTLKLRLRPGKKPLSDYLANPLGWPIMSERLINVLWPFMDGCVQLISAPLYEQKSRQLINGYSIVNVIKIVDCIDKARSIPFYSGKRLGGYYEMCIDPERTEKAHVFQCKIGRNKVSYGVICSYELVNSLVGKGFTGMAFLRCRAPDD